MTQEEFHKRYQYNPNTDCLGEGGFGKVYKAYDTHLDHYVAIKMAEVKPNFEEVRLRKEVEVISKLPTHPNIAHYDVCYTFSTFAGEYDFGVLQYYEQGNLQQLITDKQLTYYQKDSMLKQILEGIVFLHNHGIIHRDLKPQNILIALNKNGVYVPKITDFGISKKLDVNKSSVFTNSLAGAGTLSFASPEQLMGNTIRKNTDLWSFGVITCWMFTGKLPFNSGSLAVTSEAGRIELFKQITSGEVTAIIAQIPADWRNLVKQCLVVDVEKRVSGAGKCLEMLSGKAEEKIENKTLIVDEITQNTNTIDIDRIAIDNTSIVNKRRRTPRNKILIFSFLIISGIAIFFYLNSYSNEPYDFSNGLLVATKYKSGYIDINGHFSVKPKYQSAHTFSEGFASVKFNNKYGFIDRNGNQVIPFDYDFTFGFSEGLAAVEIDNKIGYIDKYGNQIVDFKYSRTKNTYSLVTHPKTMIGSFSEGFAAVILNGKYGFINKKGIEIIVPQYEDVRNFSEGLAAVKIGEKWGFIDRNGKLVIPCKYDYVSKFKDGVCAVNTGDCKTFFIDKNGKVAIDSTYDNLWISDQTTTFSEGLAPVKKNNGFGFIDHSGRGLIPFKYDFACSFEEGLAAVEKNGRWGFVNKNGIEVIPIQYTSANSFNEGLARVTKDIRALYINKNGECVFWYFIWK